LHGVLVAAMIGGGGTGMIVRLTDRGVVELTGEDRVAFLQGLVSNDVKQAAPGRAVWAALLTPQGKWLADFFILSEGGRLLLDCETAQAAMLVKTLGRYRLRSKVTLRDISAEMTVHVAWGETPLVGAVLAPDPRLPEAGWRVLATSEITDTTTPEAWHAHRIALGLPDGSRDLESDKTVLLEAGFEELHGVSWSKGCYMGQELTARTKYRGLLKRRLMPVRVDGTMPAPGTPVLQDGVQVGTLRFGEGGLALALLRLDAMKAEALLCGDASLVPAPPAWMPDSKSLA
jgi:folate-binding protein YgfZ